MSNIIPFEFEGVPVRVVDQNGDPSWVLADVCRVLELDPTSRGVRNLDGDEKGLANCHTPGGPQEMITVSEPGLYKLIAVSRKPAAKRFDRWVRHEVLPGLRKNGRYVMPGVDQSVSVAFVKQIWEEQTKVIGVQFATQGAAIAEVQAGLKANTAEIVSLRQDLGDLAPRRKKWSKDLQDQYRWTCLLNNGGKCCCGCGKMIMDQYGNELDNYRIDHLNGRHRVGPRDGLPVDTDCNQEFENNSTVRDMRLRYRAPLFHEERENLFPNGKFEDPYQKRFAFK